MHLSSFNIAAMKLYSKPTSLTQVIHVCFKIVFFQYFFEEKNIYTKDLHVVHLSA